MSDPKTANYPNKKTLETRDWAPDRIRRESGVIGSLFILSSPFVSEEGLNFSSFSNLAGLIFGGLVLSIGSLALILSLKNYARGLLYVSMVPISLACIQYSSSKVKPLEIILHMGIEWFLFYVGTIILLMVGINSFLKIPSSLANNEDKQVKLDRNLGKLGSILMIASLYVPFIHIYDAEKALSNSQTGYLLMSLALTALCLSFTNRLAHLLWIGIISLLVHMRLCDLYVAYAGETWHAHVSSYDNKWWPATTWWKSGFYLSPCGPILLMLVGFSAQISTTSSMLVKKLCQFLLR